MQINNYNLNNHAITILNYIQKFKTTSSYLIDGEDANVVFHRKVREGVDSPITKYSDNEFNFYSTSHSKIKKAILVEVKKLIKHDILKLVEVFHSGINKAVGVTTKVCVNVDFYNEIFNTDFNTILPHVNNIRSSHVNALILLTHQKEISTNINVKEFKSEISSGQTVLKELIGLGFVELLDNYGNILPAYKIYNGDRTIKKDVGKEQLHGIITITNLGLSYLIDNKIYFPFFNILSEDKIKKYNSKHKSIIDKLDTFNLKMEYRVNQNNEVLIFLSGLPIKFLTFKNKNKDFFEEINMRITHRR